MVQSVTQHYLRTPEGATYGPVDMATLCMWATDARIIPGCLLSVDRSTWTPVEAHPELRLNWSVRFDDGTTYGPLNLLAIWVLAGESSVPRGVSLVEKESNRMVVLNDSLQPLLVEECRQVLTGCSHLMGALVETAEKDRREAVSQLADRDARLEALALKLSQMEHDLAVNMRLVAESQRHLSESGNAEARAGSLSREAESLRSSLRSVRQVLSDREAEIESLTKTLADTCRELDSNRQLVQDTQRCRDEQRKQAVFDDRQNAEAGSEVGMMRMEVAGKDSEISALRTQVLSLESDLQGYASRFSVLELQLKELKQHHADACARAESAEQSSAGFRQSLAGLEQERDGQQKTISELMGQLDAMRGEVGQLGAVKIVNERLKEELALLQTQLGETRRDHRRTSEAYVSLQVVADQRAARQSELEAELRDSLQMAEAAEARARAGEESRAGLAVEVDWMRKQLESAHGEAAGKEIQIRNLEAELRDVRAASESQACQSQARLEALRLTLQNEQARYAMEMAALSQLRIEATAMTARLETLHRDLSDKESVIRRQESELAEQRNEADRQLSVLRAKNEVLESELQLGKQNARTLAAHLAQAKESAAKVQSAARVAEQKLKDEMAAIQADLKGLMLARQCILDVADKSKPAPIDWMGDIKSPPDNTEQGEGVHRRTSHLSVAEKLNLMQKELQASAEQKEMMRRKEESLQGQYELLKKEASCAEREWNEKLVQLRGELKTTAEQLDQAMREVEKRESLIRELRRKVRTEGLREAGKSAILEAEVIHEENLGPDERREGVPQPEMAYPPGGQGRATQSGNNRPEGVLSSVEAQLQRELKKWEAIKREKENKEGTVGKWFRRKSS